MSDFYKEFKEIIDREALHRGISQIEAFFNEVTYLLIEDKFCKDAIHFHYERPTMGAKMGIQIDGYGGSPSEDQNVLTIFVIDYSFSEEVEIINKDELIRTLKKGANFINQIDSSLFRSSLEETSEEFKYTNDLYRQIDLINSYEIIFLTNKSERVRIKEHNIKARNENCRISVFDIHQIEKLKTGQNIPEDMILDLEEYGNSIPVLTASVNNDYKSYLTVLNGDFLAKIYEGYGHRLLEKNVRVFLGSSRKINAGIQKTIIDEPEMFFAYNNGITATAEDITIQQLPKGRAITKIKNLQIVNGGQTISSIYYAHRKNISVSKVKVQMKLSVIDNVKNMEEITSEISRCANTQNKVDSADFSSNHKFHNDIEKKSKLRSYKPKGQSFTNTKWFYERTRGSYNDTRIQLKDRQARKSFDSEFPKKQMFVKTDLATYIHSWDQKPFLVSLGPQKNFLIFNDQIKKEFQEKTDLVDDYYFDLIIGRKILYDGIYSLVNKKNGINSSYRQVVTYTMAKLSHDIPNGYELNFQKIIESQSLDEIFMHELLYNSRLVYTIIRNPIVSISGIETEYTKKIPNEKTPKDDWKNYCWERVKELNCPWEHMKKNYLISKNDQRKLVVKKEAKRNKKIDDSVENMKKIQVLDSKGWKELLDFCEENYLSIYDTDKNLLKNCRGIARGRFFPSERQIERILWIYNLARDEGFSSENFPSDF